MLWEILTLKHPFDEYRTKYEADSQLEEAIVNGLRPSTPAELVRLLSPSLNITAATGGGVEGLTPPYAHAHRRNQVESLQAQDYVDLLCACWDPEPQQYVARSCRTPPSKEES
jgi:hypothetical protein